MGVIVLTTYIGCSTGKATASDPAISSVTVKADNSPPVSDMAMMHIYQGRMLFLQGNLEGAIREFREAIRLSPKNPIPHNNAAMALHLQDKFSEAEAEFLIAIELEPSYAAAWSNLGFALFDHGDLLAAVERWQFAIQLNPMMPSAWSGLAIGLFAMGNVEQATQRYRHALTIDFRYADVEYLRHVRHWSSRARTHAGLLLEKMQSEASMGKRKEGRI